MHAVCHKHIIDSIQHQAFGELNFQISIVASDATGAMGKKQTKEKYRIIKHILFIVNEHDDEMSPV